MAQAINRWAVLLTLLGVAIAALAFFLTARSAEDRPLEPVGLFTSLPILWGEADGVADLLKSDPAPHWALEVLKVLGEVVPLDRLSGPPGHGPLDRLGTLLIAQPRPFAPDENLALDLWVRGGGRLLLLVDPHLTEETRYAPGDPRRPQDVAMLSPLLSHWGLQLLVDEVQPQGEQERSVLGQTLPVNLPGRLGPSAKGGPCTILDGGLAAQCRIGRGRALVIADAALLEHGGGQDTADRKAVLAALLERAFAPVD